MQQYTIRQVGTDRLIGHVMAATRESARKKGVAKFGRSDIKAVLPRKRKNPVTSTSSAEGWIPCHAIRVVGDEVQMLTEGRVSNGLKSKFKKAVSKLKRAMKVKK